MNLSAKLEKHNKELGSRALCDRATYDKAIEQGYRPGGDRTTVAAVRIAEVKEPMDLIVVAP